MWLRWNQSTKIFERSDDLGANWAAIGLSSNIITQDALGVDRIPTLAQTKITSLVADLVLKAPLASPTLTGTPAAPTAAVGTNTTQIATTAYVQAHQPRVNGTTSSGTPTPNADTTDVYTLTALGAAALFGAPTGTPVNCQKLAIRIIDDATPRALTWNAIYVAGGVALPTITVASKILLLGFIYNTDNALNKWMLVASAQEA
jgi:hypothetical protein